MKFNQRNQIDKIERPGCFQINLTQNDKVKPSNLLLLIDSNYIFRSKLLLYFLILLFAITGCKKLIEIPPPVGTVTTSQVFSTDGEAESAVSGMYYNMINSGSSWSSSSMTICAGMSADELVPFNQSGTDLYAQFQQNDLSTTNLYIDNFFWADAYSTIYSANAVIEGLQDYSGVHSSVKNELTGEAEFVRAFCNFYLTNLFGDIPLVTSINWQKTNLLPRTAKAKVYLSIIADLKDAQSRLATDYSAGGGQRIVPNKWAATALLARVYLYMSNWSSADSAATAVINNSNLYSLTPDLNSVFLVNSTEAIWQLQQSNAALNNGTPEGDMLIPRVLNSTYPPFAYLTTQLLNAFEPGDNRKTSWIDSTTYMGVKYYFPYKYKIGDGQATVGGPYSEYYMVLRLSEQYLIRAEAEANGAGSGSAGAINDLNVIRNRAGLGNYSGTIGNLPSAILQERRVELFAEWGHRWLDLKRTNQATLVLQPIKPLWKSSVQLYPIPQGEVNTDPNLIQNPGY